MAREMGEGSDNLHSCTECGDTFTSSSSVRVHMRRHTGERPYSCTKCGATFAQTSTLARHKFIHTGERPFACTECEQAFADVSSLRNHKLTHSGERPFSCTVCGATFTLAGSLMIHERIHTGERPFCCTECESTFTQASALQRHERTHTGERPFSCTECEATFADQSSLRNHKLIHTGERPHKCTECEAAFTISWNLKTHAFYYHTTEGRQRRKREEERIAKVLERAGIDFKREHHVSFGCTQETFARIDFIILVNGKVIALEVDEYQHNGYGVACEVSRMVKLLEAWLLEGNTLPVRFIRYNPHAFQIDGKEQKVTRAVREARLLEVIQEAAGADGDGMQVRYMYYDEVSGQPAIMQDPAFAIDDCVRVVD